MNTDKLIITTLFYSDRKMISGRTLLQKTVYFLNEKLKLGVDFIPYYYGPYSPEVAETISSLKSTGIVSEEIVELPAYDFKVTFEPRQYRYKLTTIGKKMAKLIEERNIQEAQQIEEVIRIMEKQGVSHDYKDLSIAAKMHHILRLENKAMTLQEMRKVAKALGWDIKVELHSSIKFLEKMGLIEIK